MRAPILALLLLLSLFAPAVAEARESHVGIARVGDGDSLTLATQRGDLRIRLYAIDAPELDQICLDARGRAYECGVAARRRLADLAEGRRVACEERDRDRYGRIVAICRVGETDLNAVLVREGHAWAYRAFSEIYVGAERAARAEAIGIWSGRAVPAWDHRSGAREQARAATTDTDARGCSIKGNISRNGRRLYHTQESPDWAATRIDEAAGERWFCSEAEARAAGWEKAHARR